MATTPRLLACAALVIAHATAVIYSTYPDPEKVPVIETFYRCGNGICKTDPVPVVLADVPPPPPDDANDPRLEFFKKCSGGQRRGSGGCRGGVPPPICPVGWIYFAEYCYKNFNAGTDTKFVVTDSESTAACAAIPNAPPNVEVLVNAGVDTRAWLQANFVLWQRTVPGTPYRYNVAGSSACSCVDYLNGVLSSYQDLGQTSLCLCSAPAFPLCRFHIKNYEAPDRYIWASIETIRVLRDGQAGTPWTGESARCSCFEVG